LLDISGTYAATFHTTAHYVTDHVTLLIILETCTSWFSVCLKNPCWTCTTQLDLYNAL